MRRLSSIVLFVALCVAGFDAPPALARRHHPAPSPTPAPPVPTPLPTPTPLSETLRLVRLHERLQAIAADAPGKLGIAIVDPFRDTRFSVNGGRMYPLASVFKLAVAVAAFRLADERKLDLDDRVLVTAADLRRGYSPIADAHPRGNVTYTYWQLVRAMLVDSDNTACDYLLHVVGDPPAVQRLLDSLKLHDFAIRKTEADMQADVRAHRTFARGGDNGGTPEAVAALLAAIAAQRVALLDSTNELFVDLAAARTGDGRLRAGIPPDVELAHKTGTSDTIGGVTDATNDAGIITLPDGRHIIVVALLSASRADEATRDATIAAVARAVYDAYGP
jgi:beta-lactamase class A